MEHNWRERYQWMREVALQAGFHPPEELDPPTEGIKTAHKTVGVDEDRQWWNMLPISMGGYLMRHSPGGHIVCITPKGEISDKYDRSQAEPLANDLVISINFMDLGYHQSAKINGNMWITREHPHHG